MTLIIWGLDRFLGWGGVGWGGGLRWGFLDTQGGGVGGSARDRVSIF